MTFVSLFLSFVHIIFSPSLFVFLFGYNLTRLHVKSYNKIIFQCNPSGTKAYIAERKLEKTFVKSSISDLQKQAGDALIAIHRSYLVNPEFIRDIKRYEITLKNGTVLPVPQRKYNELRQKLITLYHQ